MKHTLTNGSAGMFGAFGGLAVSIASVNAWLQMSSLSVGLLIGLVTLYKLATKK